MSGRTEYDAKWEDLNDPRQLDVEGVEVDVADALKELGGRTPVRDLRDPLIFSYE